MIHYAINGRKKAMLAAERRQLILDKLQEDKKVVVSELSEQFAVSEETTP